MILGQLTPTGEPAINRAGVLTSYDMCHRKSMLGASIRLFREISRVLFSTRFGITARQTAKTSVTATRLMIESHADKFTVYFTATAVKIRYIYSS